MLTMAAFMPPWAHPSTKVKSQYFPQRTIPALGQLEERQTPYGLSADGQAGGSGEEGADT